MPQLTLFDPYRINDFAPANARRFDLSREDVSDWKGLIHSSFPCVHMSINLTVFYEMVYLGLDFK